jgi:hypothetical protein
LPKAAMETIIVPIGIRASKEKEITFSAENSSLPSGIKVFLEDRFKNTLTRLDEVNSNYKIVLEDDLNGIGRFYLQTKSDALHTNNSYLESISVYKTTNENLRITGLLQGKATVKLFSIQGKLVLQNTFQTNGVVDIALPNLTAGIYLVQLTTEKGNVVKKIIVE